MLQQLEKTLGAGKVVTDAASIQHYGRDWTKFFEIKAQAIVFPETVADVQAIVKWARANKIALVPSGGRTGLSGAAVAHNGEVVVSFEKMNKILDFSETDGTVTVQPGVVTESLQQFAESKGYFYPVDFAAKGSSQIGGNIATNAGGVKVVRYGLTRDWVKGLKVVTGSGELLDLNRGIVKNATGYDLRQLFIGSEGTLGFIVEATMGVTAKPHDLKVLILALPDLEAVMKVFAKFRKLPLTAFEMFSQVALEKVLEATHLPPPLGSQAPFYVLVEVESLSDESEGQILETFEKCVEDGLVLDGNVAQTSEQAKTFWRYREDISESLAKFTPYKNDISVKISQVPTFLLKVDEILRREYPDYTVVWFGHIGDGNLHVNILKPDNMDKIAFMQSCQKVDQLLFQEIKNFGGSISAEHGVGLTKKPFLHFTRSPEEIAIFRGLKKVFDPENIMNPGKIF